MSESTEGRDREEAISDLLRQIQQVCGELNVAHARLVALTAQALDEDLWQGWGIRSIEHFLCWQAGLSPSRAKQIAECARRLDELPTVMGEFQTGELSVDQVVAIAERMPSHNDEEVAQFAKCATVSQLRSTLSKRMFGVPAAEEDPEATDDSPLAGEETEPATDPAPESEQATDPAPESELATAAIAEPTLHMGQNGSRFWLHYEAPVETGALVERAITEARDRLFATNPEVSWADALADVCSRALSSAPAARAEHYRVLVHLDTGGSWINQGPAVPPALMAKLVCDGAVRPLWQTEGSPVNVGRSQRIVPERTRALVEDRDRECVFPGCHAARFLEVHHLVHWIDGGPTDTWNLACLCPYHHDAHHRGDFSVTGDADQREGLHFVDRDDRVIHAVGRPIPPSGPLPGPPSGHEYTHPRGEPIHQKWVYFSPPPTRRVTAACSVGARRVIRRVRESAPDPP